MKNAMLLSLAILLLASCATYHFGTALPAEQRKMAVAEVENLTSETALGGLVQNALHECILNTPGLKLSSEENAGLSITLSLDNLDQNKLARARTRDADARHDKSDSYQTVLYRMTVRCRYTATPTDGSPVREGSVQATADVPLMQDINLAQQAALTQLARNAARQVLSELTEE